MLLPVLLLSMMVLHNPLQAQNFLNGFGFVLPADDTSTALFLPPFPRSPITSADAITVDANGHFSRGGNPIRFWGTNLVADAAFADPSKAWFIAGRLRKLGFNLIRLHHMDNPWSQGSLFEWGSDTRHLNPATLGRLDHLLAALKDNGIYVDVNLHVGRTFRASDGVPDADSLPEFGKCVTQFDPQLIALQKEYAHQLLTHLNPYTGTELRNDPMVAMVEISNENSLYRFWRENLLRPVGEGGVLTVRHDRMLDSLWNAHLLQSYGSTDSLRAVWNRDTLSPEGTDQIVNGTFESALPSTGWTMELHNGSQAVMSRDNILPFAGNYSARVQVQTATGTDWNIQWKQVGLDVSKDSSYTVRFAARSDSIRTISFNIMNDASPWNGYLWRSITLTPAWQEFVFTLIASETNIDSTRLSFALGSATGTFWFDNIKLESAEIRGLLPGETIEAGSVDRTRYDDCAGYTPARTEDISAFYIGLEQSYFREMKSYLNDTLGVTAPVSGTNWNVGSADLAAQTEEVDYVDNHAYWQHPWFPNEPWSPWDWQMENSSMVASTTGGTIPVLFSGVGRTARPFTVSEYGHPFPSRFQSEGLLFLSSYGAFHDADALMLYEYNQSSGTDWESDFVNGFFDNHRNTSLMALMPSLAFAYRSYAVAKANETVVVNYSRSDFLRQPVWDAGDWNGPVLFDRRIGLEHGVRTGTFESPVPVDVASFPPAPSPPFVTDTGELTWKPGSVFTVSAPRIAAMTGELHTAEGDSAGPMKLLSADGYATLTWVSLTPDSLIHSARSLLTITTRLQNTNMVWDGTTTVHDQWGTAPTLNEPRMLTIRLRVDAPMLAIIRLDPLGNPTSDSMLVGPVAPGLFDVTIDQSVHPSPWFGVSALSSADVQFVSVPSGWTLLSLPLRPVDPQTSALFPGAVTTAYTFADRYVQVDTLGPGIGYWLKFSSSQVVAIHGELLRLDTLRLHPGWNMIGTPGVIVPAADVQTIPPGLISGGFFAFDGGYSLSDTLRPWRGYWVKSGGPGWLVIGNGSVPRHEVGEESRPSGRTKRPLSPASPVK